MQHLLAVLKDPDAAAKWIKSMKGNLTSRSFNTLISATGSMPQAVTWLQTIAPLLPRESKQIERLHVGTKDPKSDTVRRTTISLDHELYASLIARTGSGKAASAWITKTAKTLDPSRGSLSRALQAEIVRYISQPPLPPDV